MDEVTYRRLARHLKRDCRDWCRRVLAAGPEASPNVPPHLWALLEFEWSDLK